MNTKLLYARVLDEMISNPRIRRELAEVIPYMEKAERFVFESYGDADMEVFSSVYFTAEEMIDAGFFHLPYPIVWIEDPWDYDEMVTTNGMDALKEMMDGIIPSKAEFDRWGRQLYLCIESKDEIKVWGITSTPDPMVGHRYLYHTIPSRINLRSDRLPNENWKKELGGALHAVKQFVVTLATKQAEIAQVPGKQWRPKCPVKLREYGYRTVQIKVGGVTQSEHHASTGAKRKLELVRGYMYGKNTRPFEKQRWVAPYWRGDEKLGVVMRDHYEVKK